MQGDRHSRKAGGNTLLLQDDSDKPRKMIRSGCLERWFVIFERIIGCRFFLCKLLAYALVLGPV